MNLFLIQRILLEEVLFSDNHVGNDLKIIYSFDFFGAVLWIGDFVALIALLIKLKNTKNITREKPIKEMEAAT